MKQINVNELKAMIANRVKEIGLNDVLDDAAIETIKEKVKNEFAHQKASSQIPEMIPEAMNSPLAQESPLSMEPEASIEIVTADDDGTITPGQNIDHGTTGNIPGFAPESYTPELPNVLANIGPAKIVVFSQNELSEGGENLSNKPLRTFEDPDTKKSMHDFWINNGQTKAEVYIAKLEKVGDLEFNYANGTTIFIEKRFEPDFEAQAKYKENPYAAKNAMDGVQSAGDQVLNQIATAVDLHQIAKDIVVDMLKGQIMATNATPGSESFGAKQFVTPDVANPSIPPNPSMPIMEALSVKMIDLVDSYNKVDLPVQLKEALNVNDKKFLVRENSEVQEWIVEGKTYYTPVNRISNKKCYTKSLL